MKLIKSSYEILEPEYNLDGIYKEIERAGRTCYKSEDKITDTSAKEFVDRMINSGHNAMLEHGTVYLKFIGDDIFKADKYIYNKYSRIGINKEISTNYRVLVENGWLDDLQYLCEPTKYHEKRIGVKFICDRGVSHELVRNRGALGNAFAQESTRYCNYSKDKFGNELTFIIPSWLEDIYSGNSYDEQLCKDFDLTITEGLSKNSARFVHMLCQTETSYNFLLGNGWKPQQARAVLPNSLKTEIIVTGFISDWEHFFELRDSKAAHPDMYALAHPLHEQFKELNYVV